MTLIKKTRRIGIGSMLFGMPFLFWFFMGCLVVILAMLIYVGFFEK